MIKTTYKLTVTKFSLVDAASASYFIPENGIPGLCVREIDIIMEALESFPINFKGEERPLSKISRYLSLLLSHSAHTYEECKGEYEINLQRELTLLLDPVYRTFTRMHFIDAHSDRSHIFLIQHLNAAAGGWEYFLWFSIVQLNRSSFSLTRSFTDDLWLIPSLSSASSQTQTVYDQEIPSF